MKVLMPVPRFSHVAIMFPYIGRYFRFLEKQLSSEQDLSCELLSPKFFTLPIEILRKRNHYLATKSCIKVLTEKRISFDLIHAHFLENGFIGAKLKGLYNKPFVLTAHGGDVYKTPFKNSWYNALARYILREADQVITVSRFNAKILLSLGVSPCKLHVVPNGYNERLFKPMPMDVMRKRLGLPVSKKILLSVGNLVYVKGHIYLVEAMRFVLKERNDVILIIVGSGPLRENLERRVKKLGLNDKIMFVGGRPHEEIPLWMNACDMLILPSLCEGFPTVIPEAMACGKPVVASNVGGIPEILSSNELGILVPPKDPKSLAWAIIKAVNTKWNRDVILHYSKKYSWSKLVKSILQVYQRILVQ